MYWLIKILIFIPVRLFVPFKVVGKKNRVKKGKVIVVCNHQSLLDCLILMIIFGRKLIFVAKKEVFNNKFMAWILKNCGVIKVDRENVSVSSVKEILTVLKQEQALCIFPEGTRNKLNNGELLPFKDGISVFAKKSCAPVLPIYIKNKPRFFHFSKVYIGEPFLLTQELLENYEKNENINKNVTNIVKDKIEKLKTVAFYKKN